MTDAVPGELGRRFEAVLIGWDGLLEPVRELGAARGLVERLSAAGVDVYVIGRGPVGHVDRRLRARPTGPGRLLLCGNHGSEVSVVDGQRITPVNRQPSPASCSPSRTDESDSVRWIVEDLAGRGIGPGLVLAVGGDLTDPGAEGGPGSPLMRGGGGRCAGVRITSASDRARVGELCDLLSEQVERRVAGAVPDIDDDPLWTFTVDGLDPRLERLHESWLAIADGRLGTRGTPLLDHPAAQPGVLAAGVYAGRGSDIELTPCPEWATLAGQLTEPDALRRRLDLRTGVLRHDLRHDGRPVAAVALSSLARPRTVALRVAADPTTLPPSGQQVTRAGLTAAIIDRLRGGGLDRIGAFAADEAEALAAAAEAQELGFDRLLTEHRAAWAARWAGADVVIDGAPELQSAIRLALFHLMGSVASTGEAAVGARGLSGPGYRGHVFWDSDVFVLPFLAATHPGAARAMLEYRLRRVDAARATAAQHGHQGDRFPWECAAGGFDVTPPVATMPNGEVAHIETGMYEEHIVADIAWAASCYLDWTGDAEFAGPARKLLLETACYWASRVRLDDDGCGHVDGVVGPDEYHGPVDDNVFTNVMARWNLRRAAEVDGADAAAWRALADRIVDGFDPRTGRYEQFAGFYDLEPLLITDVAHRRPVAADLLLGRGCIERTQLIKQADVLMLHHLVPDEVATGTLEANLDFYEPRTAHGSSLSPAIHAALLARAGRFPAALAALRIAARIDLDDLTGSTASGVHLATMGGLWQALVFGFAGVRPRGNVLVVDPRLPPQWQAMHVRLSFRGAPFTLHVDHRGAQLDTDGRLALVACDGRWEVHQT